MKITVELDADQVAALARLAGNLSTQGDTPQVKAQKALLDLADCAVTGARRPGSWEREWVERVFWKA